MDAKKPSLSIYIEGTVSDRGFVDAEVFTRLMADVLRCLNSLSTVVTGKKTKHLITGLEIGSAGCTFSAPENLAQEEIAEDTYRVFEKTVAAIELGKAIDPRLGVHEIQQFEKLAKPFAAGVQSLRLGKTKVTGRYGSTLQKILAGVTHSVGTCKGRIEELRTHGRNTFRLYPAIPGHAILCNFDEALFKQIHKAFRRNVTVYGKKSSMADKPYPSIIEVSSIEVHPEDADLPTLSDLRGIAPKLTAGKSVPEYLRAIRDE